MRVLNALFHQLGLMRTAVGLLALCAFASMAGTVVPQGLPLEDYAAEWGVDGALFLWHSGLTDVFRAWWFLLILLVMLASVAACLWRNGPIIWRQLAGNFGKPVALGAMVDAKVEDLHAAGFRRVSSVEGAELWQRGRMNRLGYFLVHIGVLGVAASGLLTGFAGWRGVLNIREGESDNVALVWKGREAEAKFLPFSLKNEEFIIEHYPSGMPRRFATRLNVDGEVHEVEVNMPLRVGDYRFYQASFGDGGSAVESVGIRLADGSAVPFAARVYETARLGDGTRVELLDFRPFTVETMAGAKPTDVGPSVDYLVQPPDAPAMQLRAYLNHPDIVGMADGQKVGGMDEGTVIYRPVWLGIADRSLWPLVARVARGEDYKTVMEPVLRGMDGETERVAVGVAVMNAAKMVKELGLTHLVELKDFKLKRYSGLQVVYDPAAEWFWGSSLMLMLGVVLMLGRRYARVWVVKGKVYGSWRPERD